MDRGKSALAGVKAGILAQGNKLADNFVLLVFKWLDKKKVTPVSLKAKLMGNSRFNRVIDNYKIWWDKIHSSVAVAKN